MAGSFTGSSLFSPNASFSISPAYTAAAPSQSTAPASNNTTGAPSFTPRSTGLQRSNNEGFPPQPQPNVQYNPPQSHAPYSSPWANSNLNSKSMYGSTLGTSALGGGNPGTGTGWGAGASTGAASHGGPHGSPSAPGGLGPFGGGTGDVFGAHRSQYQSGYLMSVNTHSASQPGQVHFEEPPEIPTKTKMNTFSGGSTSDFDGQGSMFQSSRLRQQSYMDEDAPPMASVNDIVREVRSSDSFGPRFQPRSSMFDSQINRSQPQSQEAPTPARSESSTVYVIVYGYPPDRYTATVEYFKSLGDATEPEQNTEITNAFKIGYRNGGEALRAARKNGEVLGGSWMIGVKLADYSHAVGILGWSALQAALTPQLPGSFGSPSSPDAHMSMDTGVPSPSTSGGARSPSQQALVPSTVGTYGTQIPLAPAIEAFRKPGSGKPAAAVTPKGPVVAATGWGTPSASPSKGVVAQVSDLIFGW